jgi:hypothetical protein
MPWNDPPFLSRLRLAQPHAGSPVWSFHIWGERDTDTRALDVDASRKKLVLCAISAGRGEFKQTHIH